jgi:acyl carrier protein
MSAATPTSTNSPARAGAGLPTDHEVLAEIARVAHSRLAWSGTLARELDLLETFALDSLRQITLMVELEDAFRIRLDEGDERTIRTVGDLVDLIRAKAAEREHDAR